MTIERIKEIQETTAYPNSISVMLALMKVWNECVQEQKKNSYSEEEVLNLLLKSEEFTSSHNGRTDLTKWFKQFKK